MRRFTGDNRNEEGRDLMPAERDRNGTTLDPAFEGVAGNTTLSRRQMVGLAGASLASVAGLAAFGSNKAEAAPNPPKPPKIAAGSTQPGIGWQQYGNGIYIDVDTSSAKFSTTPVYVISLSGTGARMWDAVGSNALYSPTPKGFRVYLRHYKDAPLTRLDALDEGWYVNWHAVLR